MAYPGEKPSFCGPGHGVPGIAADLAGVLIPGEVRGLRGVVSLILGIPKEKDRPLVPWAIPAALAQPTASRYQAVSATSA